MKKVIISILILGTSASAFAETIAADDFYVTGTDGRTNGGTLDGVSLQSGSGSKTWATNTLSGTGSIAFRPQGSVPGVGDMAGFGSTSKEMTAYFSYDPLTESTGEEVTLSTANWSVDGAGPIIRVGYSSGTGLFANDNYAFYLEFKADTNVNFVTSQFFKIDNGVSTQLTSVVLTGRRDQVNGTNSISMILNEANTLSTISGEATGFGNSFAVQSNTLAESSLGYSSSEFNHLKFEMITTGTNLNFPRVGEMSLTSVPEPSHFAALVGIVGLFATVLRRRRKTI